MTPSGQVPECNNVNSSSQCLDLGYKPDRKKLKKEKPKNKQTKQQFPGRCLKPQHSWVKVRCCHPT